MAINEKIPPEPTRLTLMDRAVGFYHSIGEDFVSILDNYLSCFPEAKRYVFTGPNYFLLFHEEDRVNPLDPNSETREPYWYITYMANETGSLLDFLRLMPYKLDTVAFHRYGKYPNRRIVHLSTDKLLKRYGLTLSSETTTPASASAAPDASGSTAHQAGGCTCRGGESDCGCSEVCKGGHRRSNSGEEEQAR